MASTTSSNGEGFDVVPDCLPNKRLHGFSMLLLQYALLWSLLDSWISASKQYQFVPSVKQLLPKISHSARPAI